jgi:hypothetical protein
MSDKHEMTLDEAIAGLPPDFAFFSERFRTQIRPGLEAREGDRLGAVKRQRNFAIGGVAGGIGIGIVGQLLAPDMPLGWFFGFILAAGLWVWGGQKLRALAKETKLMLIKPVATEFGMSFELAPGQPAEIMRFRQLGLVGSWDRANYEDRLTGKRKDAPFNFFEAHLEEKRTTTDSKGRTRTTWVTIFKGQCLVVKFSKNFEGVTKVFRDAGIFNGLQGFGQREKKVRLEDPRFEKQFEVYGSDQIEARFILTPDFMERLLKLEKTFSGKRLRCAFSEGEMLLCVEGKNLFEAGSMYRKMDDMSRVREMLQDFAAVFLLIDSMGERLTPDALRGTVIT